MKHAISLVLRKIASIPADLALGFTNLPLVMGYLEKRHDISLRCSEHQSALQKTAVTQLDRKGVFVTDVDSLGCSSDAVHEVVNSGKQLAAVLARRGTEAGSVRPAVMMSTPADLLDFPAIYRWGLHPIILGIVEAYLREPVAYDGVQVYHALADGRETGSRRWHRDREDRRVIKVAVYLNDVSELGGPFQSVHYEVQRVGQPFHYRIFDTRRLEQVLGSDVTSRKTNTCPGKAGTLIFAETARFYHRGKPATDSERSAMFFSYFARSPLHPFYCARTGLSRANLVELIEGLSPEQQAAALWRDTLPLVARIIPPSLV